MATKALVAELKPIDKKHLAKTKIDSKKADETVAAGKAIKDRLMAKAEKVKAAIADKSKPKKAVPKINLEEDVAVEPTDSQLMNIFKLCEYVMELDKQLTEVNAKLNQINGHRLKLVEVDIPEAMKTIGMKMLTLEDGRTVEVKTENYGSYTKDNEASVFAWLRKNGHGSLIKNVIAVQFGKGDDEKAAALEKFILSKKFQDWAKKESIHANTFKAFVREQLEAGNKLPKQIAVFPKSEAIIKEPKNGNQSKNSTGSSKQKQDLF